MNWLPLLILLLFAKKFTSHKKGLGSENLLSILKLAANVKESGILDLLKNGEPLSAIFSGNFPVEKLLEFFSAFPLNQSPKEESEIPRSSCMEEVAGEEMGCVLKDMLNQKHLVMD